MHASLTLFSPSPKLLVLISYITIIVLHLLNHIEFIFLQFVMKQLQKLPLNPSGYTKLLSNVLTALSLSLRGAKCIN